MGKAKPRATADEPRFLDGYLPYLMARASYLISAQFQRHLAARGIRTSVWRILATLAGTSGRTIGELADEMILQQPTVTKIVDRLEKDGLIERGSSANDRRQVIVQLTPRGVALISSLQKEATQHQDDVLGAYTKTETELLFRVLRTVVDRNGAQKWGKPRLVTEQRGVRRKEQS